jgi:hypothetical protein
MLAAKDIRAFGHEVDAAEDDVAAQGLGSLEGEFQGITTEIGELDDLVALVMMAKDDDIFAESGFGGGDAIVKGVIWDEQVGIEIAAYAGFEFGGAEGRRLVCADEGAAIRDGYEVAHD